MSNDRPVFVVGCPRSGTTLLTLMLHAHPRIAIPGAESRFLVSTWLRRRRFRGLPAPEAHRRLADAVTAPGTKIRDLGLKRREVAAEILAGPPTLGSAYGIVFRAYARRFGKPRWGDKRPAYHRYTDTLLRLFPDAQIIHIVRDGRACVASLKRMPWWRQSSIDAMTTWSLAVHCAERDQRRLPKDAFHVIRYEDLIADPRTEMRKICEFLGEDFDEAMIEPHRQYSNVPSRKSWHTDLNRELGAVPQEGWRTGLEAWELGLMELALRRKLKRFGYQLSGAGSRPSAREVARYYRKSLQRHTAAQKRWRKERREAENATYPIAAQLTTAQLEAVGSD